MHMWRGVWVGLGVLGMVACGGGSDGADDAGQANHDGDPSASDAAPAADAAPAPSDDDLVTACTILGSCRGQDPNDCIDDFLPLLSQSEIRCLVDAGGDCNAAFACTGIDAFEGPCTPGCDGDQTVFCGEVSYAVDCPTSVTSTGPSCTLRDDLPICAGEGECTGGESICDGSWVLNCQSGKFQGANCSRYGWTCESGDPFSRCTDGTRILCDDNNYPRCEQNVLVECQGGIEIRRSCSRTVDGVGCHVFSDDPDGYCGLGAECNPLIDNGTCDGDVLTFCAAGQTRSVDCGELGFGGCQAVGELGPSRCTL